MIPLFVTGHGAVTALGLDAPRTIASLRGGLDGLTKISLSGVQVAKDLRAVPVQGYAEGIMGAPRIEALAARALAECLPALNEQEPRDQAVFIGLPVVANRPGLDPALDVIVREGLERRFGFPRGTIRTVPEGRTSVFTALRQAEAWLKAGPHACIVGAVDSLLHPADLRALSERGVLAEEYDGFFPGEAAAFVCLSRRSTVGPLGRKAAAVVGAADAIEPADGSAGAPLVGVGMANAIRKAFADGRVPESSLGLCINSVNGTRTEFEDEAFARIRVMRVAPTAAPEIWHLASFLGETGAAYGGLALLWANAALELGVEYASTALLTASEGRRRNAIIVHAALPNEIVNAARAPEVGLAEPVRHTLAPIVTTDAKTIDGDPGIRLGELDDRHRQLAIRDFDQLANLIVVREGHLRSHSPWTDIESFERRALAHLDALAWSGDMARDLAYVHLKGESEEAAAATLLLCCTPARGGEIERLLEACAQSDEHRARIAGNAAICPRDVAEPFLLKMAAADKSFLGDALWALGISRWLTPDWLSQVAKGLGNATPDLIVALGVMANPGTSSTGWPLDWLTSSGTPLPVGAALAGMVLDTPKAWLASFRSDDLVAHMPEALGVGVLQTHASVLPSLGKAPTPTRGAMIALGWSGEAEGTSLLLDGLQSEDEEVASEAARSLARMYGIRPIETVVEDEEEDEAGAPAGTAGGDAPAPPPRKTDRLSLNRSQWEHALGPLAPPPPGGRQQQRHRLRGGRPWTRGSAVKMLLDPKTPCDERAVAIWEYAIVNRQPLPIHIRQWVATQRRALTPLATS